MHALSASFSLAQIGNGDESSQKKCVFAVSMPELILVFENRIQDVAIRSGFALVVSFRSVTSQELLRP